MLSILLPVYNWDVRPLAYALHAQALSLGVSFEIILLDDGSASAYRELNRQLTALEHLHYEELPANIGRAAIRNLLAARSRFPYLLFIDADSGIVREDYLEQYLRHCAEDTVLTGGTVYQSAPPEQPAYHLRWLYGVRREQRTISARQSLGWEGFMTHHFMVPRRAFERVHFEEKLRHYGHEDTLFGIALQKAGFSIVHIDNPLLHEGLEPAVSYLEKVESSLRNLVFLQSQGMPVNTRLWAVGERLRRLGVSGLLGMSFVFLGPLLYRQLLGARPKLWMLDAYKLLLLCTLLRDR